MTFGLPDDLAHVVVTAENETTGQVGVFLRRLPGGPTVHLADSSALIWLAAVDGCADVASAVADLTGADPEEIRPQVDGFVAELLARSLVQVLSDGTPAPE